MSAPAVAELGLSAAQLCELLERVGAKYSRLDTRTEAVELSADEMALIQAVSAHIRALARLAELQELERGAD